MIREMEFSLYEEKCKIRTLQLENNTVRERKKWHYKQEQLGEDEQEHHKDEQECKSGSTVHIKLPGIRLKTIQRIFL